MASYDTYRQQLSSRVLRLAKSRLTLLLKTRPSRLQSILRRSVLRPARSTTQETRLVECRLRSSQQQDSDCARRCCPVQPGCLGHPGTRTACPDSADLPATSQACTRLDTRRSPASSLTMVSEQPASSAESRYWSSHVDSLHADRPFWEAAAGAVGMLGARYLFTAPINR